MLATYLRRFEKALSILQGVRQEKEAKLEAAVSDTQHLLDSTKTEAARLLAALEDAEEQLRIANSGMHDLRVELNTACTKLQAAEASSKEDQVIVTNSAWTACCQVLWGN